MAAPPFMGVHIGDYQADTQHLVHADEHGAYFLILMSLWRWGGELPNDPEIIRRIAKVRPQRWPAIWRLLEPLFKVNPDNGKLIHKRLGEELDYVRETSRARSFVGKLGGHAKALKTKKPKVAIAKQLSGKRLAPKPTPTELDSSYRAISNSGETLASAVEKHAPVSPGEEAAPQHKSGLTPAERKAQVDEVLGQFQPRRRRRA